VLENNFNNIGLAARSDKVPATKLDCVELACWRSFPNYIEIIDSDRQDDAEKEGFDLIIIHDRGCHWQARSWSKKNSETGYSSWMARDAAEATVKKSLSFYDLGFSNTDRDTRPPFHHRIKFGSAAKAQCIMKRRSS
jgi:hypothetical protein